MEPAQLGAVALSLRVAAAATAFSLPPAIAVAWFLARANVRGKLLVDALVHVPLVLPPVVTGYLLLALLGPNTPVGAWLDNALGVMFAFNWKGAALAGAVMGFPLMVRPIRLSLEALDPRVEQAAASLGASPIWVCATVTLPLALPGIIAGAVLAFARAFGEFGATITFVSNIPGKTRTLPIAIYTFIQMPGGADRAHTLIVIAVVVSFAALLGSELTARRIKRLQRSA